MSKIFDEKIDEATAKIAALQRQADGALRQIELLKVRVQVLKELASEEASTDSKGARAQTHRQGQFVAVIPWAQIWDTLKGREFTAGDVRREIESRGHTANANTIRSRLTHMVNLGVLQRVSDGRFKVVSSMLKSVAAA
jgi:hypothetical protein